VARDQDDDDDDDAPNVLTLHATHRHDTARLQSHKLTHGDEFTGRADWVTDLRLACGLGALRIHEIRKYVQNWSEGWLSERQHC